MGLDGLHTYVVARSVTFYEQSLVHAMRESIGLTVSDGSTSITVPQGLAPHTLSSEGLQNNLLGTEQQDGSHSSSDLSTRAQAKLQSPTGRDLLTSRKALFLTPTTPAVVGEGILDPQPKRLHGKYSRLRRELSLALRASTNETVCAVTVTDTIGDNDNHDFEMVAAHVYSGWPWECSI